MTSLDRFAASELAALEARDLRRSLAETAREAEGYAVRNGRRLLSFSCNDYLNLSQHPAVKAAAADAVHRHGAGAGASRLVTGNHPLYAALEARLARLKGTEAACVFGSGYLANIAIVETLVGKGDLVLADRLAHACLYAGARIAGASLLRFRHNDPGHAEALLARNRAGFRHVLIVTDRVFSMDGDLAPLDDLMALAGRFDAWLLADDAHGLGVVGGGAKVPLQMGTLSKAVGSYGGYLCASRPVIDLIHSRARPLIFSTGLPPAAVAAAAAALDVIEADPSLAARPLLRAREFTRALGLPEAVSPIVPLILGEAGAALAASRLLETEGFLVAAIRPPTVPPGTARLRFAFTAAHSAADVARLAEAVRRRILGRS